MVINLITIRKRNVFLFDLGGVMKKRTDYKDYELSRKWGSKRKAVTKANQLGFKFVGEAVCTMFDAGDNAKKIGEIFGFTSRWSRTILQDMGRLERAEYKPIGPKAERYRMPKDLLEKFMSGYDGYGSMIDYARKFKDQHPEVKISETLLSERLTKKKKKKHNHIVKTNYKMMDRNRTWAYHSDLLEIANEIGCEYITEAVAKLHALGLYGPDIGKRFERSESWAISILDYLGLSKYPRGGTKHHMRNK